MADLADVRRIALRLPRAYEAVVGDYVKFRVGRLVFGAVDPKAGAAGSLYNLCVDPRLNHEVEIRGGVRADEASRLLSDFFAGRRS